MSRFSQGARQVIPTPTWTVIKHCKEVFTGNLVNTDAGYVQVPFVRSIFQKLLSFDLISNSFLSHFW